MVCVKTKEESEEKKQRFDRHVKWVVTQYDTVYWIYLFLIQTSEQSVCWVLWYILYRKAMWIQKIWWLSQGHTSNMLIWIELRSFSPKIQCYCHCILQTFWKQVELLLLLLFSCTVVSDSLEPTRLLCPWDFPGKHTGVGCHFLLQSGAKYKLNSHMLVNVYSLIWQIDKYIYNSHSIH